MTNPKVLICPYCGGTQPAGDRCRACGGLFEPLSRQATHNAMGPWFVRDPARPFQPGCSYETLLKMIERGQVTKLSIVRGPTTRQYWTVAKRVPGIAHVLGYCHACDAGVDPDDHGCHECGVPFGAYLDRNFLGLPEVRPMPWEAGFDSERAAAEASASGAGQWGSPAQGVGISSFASDAELLGRPTAPHAAVSGGGGGGIGRPGAPGAHFTAAGHQAQTAHVFQSPLQAALGGAAESSPFNGGSTRASSASTRALQRNLARQQRTIRLLIAALVLAAIGLILSFAVMNTGSNGSPRLATHPTAALKTDQPPPAAGRTARPMPPPDESSDAVAAHQPSIPPQPIEQRPVETSAPRVEPAVPRQMIEAPPAGPYAAEYDRAVILLSSARQADRPVKDRIRDYEEALQVLQNIADTAPADQRPAELDRTIDEAQQELDRLRPAV